MYKDVYIYTCIHVYLYTFAYIYVYIYVYVYAHTHVHVYNIHTYMNAVLVWHPHIVGVVPASVRS